MGCGSLVFCFALRAHMQAISQKPALPAYDGFEGSSLSNLWETDRFAPGAVVLQSKIVNSGRQALAITVHSRDVFEAGRHGSADSERAELREARQLVGRENQGYEYSFNMFFPPDFVIVPTRLVIAQWKQYCGSDQAPCSDDSPVLALRYIGGFLSITQDLQGRQVILFRKQTDLRARWTTFVVQARFSAGPTGRIRVWMNEQRVVDFEGVSANPENARTGYADPSHFFFKMGLYRNVMDVPMTVYIDEYRKRELRDDEF